MDNVTKITLVMLIVMISTVCYSYGFTNSHAEEIICRCKKRWANQYVTQIWCVHREIKAFNQIIEYSDGRDLHSTEFDVFLKALHKWCGEINFECSNFEYTGSICDWGLVLEEIKKSVKYYRRFCVDVDMPGENDNRRNEK